MTLGDAVLSRLLRDLAPVAVVNEGVLSELLHAAQLFSYGDSGTRSQRVLLRLQDGVALLLTALIVLVVGEAHLPVAVLVDGSAGFDNSSLGGALLRIFDFVICLFVRQIF